MTRFLTAVVFLTLTYALFLASFHPWDLVIGAGLSGALVFVFRDFLFGGKPKNIEGPGILSRFVAFWPYTGAVLWDITTGTWEVALVTLHLRPLVKPGIVAVPIENRTPLGVAVSALATTLSPGTFLVDVDWEKRVMLIHAIDASDPDVVREALQHMYRRYQSKVFP